jgi:prepilin-type N-terminal cleavage/methylation domain-containing protein
MGKTLKQRDNSQAGFSVVEMIIAITVMAIIAGAVFSLMRDSLKVASTTYEMTDAQESLRTAQEYINRDLMNAGDTLNSISNIKVPRNFVRNYLTVAPVDNPSTPGYVSLGLLTSDNNVPASTVVLGTSPAVTLRNPVCDRITILQIDPSFTPVALAASAINSTGNQVTVSNTAPYRVGEVYFLTSDVGGVFGTITSITSPNLFFNGGDTLGLNVTGAGGQINTISAGGTIPTSLMRVRVIHYYLTSQGMLMRRVFGVRGASYTDSLIAEHVTSLQFRYFLSMRDAGGNVVQPVLQLTNSQEQLSINQVEVSVTVETPHALQNGNRPPISMTTSTSLRNMQFRGALGS